MFQKSVHIYFVDSLHDTDQILLLSPAVVQSRGHLHHTPHPGELQTLTLDAILKVEKRKDEKVQSELGEDKPRPVKQEHWIDTNGWEAERKIFQFIHYFNPCSFETSWLVIIAGLISSCDPHVCGPEAHTGEPVPDWIYKIAKVTKD